jgi:hypothetical protein
VVRHFSLRSPAKSNQADTFDFAILCSVLTHMLPEVIENYLRQTTRVLARGDSAFISVFLFDPTAALAVNDGTTTRSGNHAQRT